MQKIGNDFTMVLKMLDIIPLYNVPVSTMHP